ncbi:MAG: hypothetical protein IT303_16725 [Dehalococcoidia bacterium]|nr:hypothetical protein [Dehalococcoidia bacterium]
MDTEETDGTPTEQKRFRWPWQRRRHHPPRLDFPDAHLHEEGERTTEPEIYRHPPDTPPRVDG